MRKQHNAQQELATNIYSGTVSLAQNYLLIICLVIGIVFSILGGLAYWGSTKPEYGFGWQLSILGSTLIALGTSLIAAVIFYELYSRIAEQRVLFELGQQVVQISNQNAMELFRQHFEKMMPAKIYPPTNAPIQGFNEDFEGLFARTKQYRYKGDVASYLSYRLKTYLDKGLLKNKEIKILLIDPRDNSLLESRAQAKLGGNSSNSYSREAIKTKADELRQKIFVTLVAVYDISSMTNIEITFHKERLFFRSEIMDGGIFLTYYVGDLPSSYLYCRDTLAYDAHLLNFNQNYNATKEHWLFNNQCNEDYLVALLKELKCENTLEDLRDKMNKRFEKHERSIISDA